MMTFIERQHWVASFFNDVTFAAVDNRPDLPDSRQGLVDKCDEIIRRCWNEAMLQKHCSSAKKQVPGTQTDRLKLLALALTRGLEAAELVFQEALFAHPTRWCDPEP